MSKLIPHCSNQWKIVFWAWWGSNFIEMKNFKKQKSFILWSEPMVKWFLAESKFCKLDIYSFSLSVICNSFFRLSLWNAKYIPSSYYHLHKIRSHDLPYRYLNLENLLSIHFHHTLRHLYNSLSLLSRWNCRKIQWYMHVWKNETDFFVLSSCVQLVTDKYVILTLKSQDTPLMGAETKMVENMSIGILLAELR